MDLTPYVDSLRRDLVTAAEAAGPEAASITERLGFALDPAARLALMEAISQAASEITAEMPIGGVDVRLDGRQLAFVVDASPPPPAPLPPPAPVGPGSGESAEDDGVARITLRLPESVKARAEELAARSGHSLNTWLVNALRAATREGAVNVEIDLSSLSLDAHGDNGFGGGRFTTRNGRRMNGWI